MMTRKELSDCAAAAWVPESTVVRDLAYDGFSSLPKVLIVLKSKAFSRYEVMLPEGLDITQSDPSFTKIMSAEDLCKCYSPQNRTVKTSTAQPHQDLLTIKL